jgi:hypothetical protein
MLKHIVCWKIKETDGVSKEENLLKMKSLLESIPSQISEIIDLEVGINVAVADTAFDISLYSSFRDQGALEAYQKHPAHVEVGNFIKSVAIGRAVVDYNM